MFVYSYHPQTGEFVGVSPADESPLEPGVFLVPSFSTTLVPKLPAEGYALVFQNSVWTEVRDRRGEVWWSPNGEVKEIDFLGDPVERGYSQTPPEPETPPQIDPLPPLETPLERLDFWLVAASAGISKWSVRDRIAAMPEGVEKNEAIAWFEDSPRYRRNDPLLISLAEAEGIPPEQLDTLWTWAVGD